MKIPILISFMSNNLPDRIIEYFRDKKEITAVYLFGSYAAGKERRFSDIDLGILMEESSAHDGLTKKIEYQVELSRILRKDIHLVLLNSAGEALLRQVFEKGRCVLINNPQELSRKKMVMFSEIADFAYYQSKMQSGLIRKVMGG